MILHNKKGILYLAILCSIIGTLFIYHNYKGQIKFFFHKPDLIHWTKDVTLTLSDFTGEINQNSSSKYSSFIGFYLYSPDLKDAHAKAYFHKKKSWIRDTSNFSTEMKFQRLRFDLYEYYARKFNAEIDKIKLDRTKSYNDLQAIGDIIYKEVKLVDDSIYYATNKLEIRKRWRDKLNAELDLK